MASDIWLRTILIVRKETRCRHIGYCYRLAARVILYAPSHRQDNTYHGLCYTSRGALAGTRNSSMGPPHEGSIRRPTVPSANALPLSYVPLLSNQKPTNNEELDDSDDKFNICLVCCEHFRDSRSREKWVQCQVCKHWAHEVCTPGEFAYVCQNCESDVDSD